MKHALCLVLALFCLDVGMLSAAPQTAEVQPFPKELRDPTFLRQLTWRADERLESVVAGWPRYSGLQVLEDGLGLIIQRRTSIPILGIPFKADYETYKAKGDAKIIIEKPGGGVTADCDVLFTWAKGAFGQPEKVVDLSSFNAPSHPDVMADWVFGETRVRFWCFEISLPQGLPVLRDLILEYSHRERLSALEDLIHLECSSETTSTGDDVTGRRGLARPIEFKFMFELDPNHDDLLIDWNNEVQHAPVELSEKEIVARFDTATSIVEVRIDRAAGSYMMTSRLKNGNPADSHMGKCVRILRGKQF